MSMDIQKRHILILVPHPDDEIVACAAALQRAREQGAQIFALYLTHGCLAQTTLWPWQRKNYKAIVARRRQEAEQVAQHLMLQPVGWSMRPARYLWQELTAVYEEILHSLNQYAIDEVWLPAYEGGNADHDGLNAIGSILNKSMKVIEFAEYNYFQNKKHSQEFLCPNGSEVVLKLTQEEQAYKRRALDLYPSEKLNLNYVEVVRESYRPLASYDYTKAPHQGTLWYQRFQWVPFRHPQVDFTDPRDVCQALTEFLVSKAGPPIS